MAKPSSRTAATRAGAGRDALIEARPQPRPADVVRHARRGHGAREHDGERDLRGVGHARGGGQRHRRQPAELHRHIDGYEGDGPGRRRREFSYLIERAVDGAAAGLAARGAVARRGRGRASTVAAMRGRARGVALRPQPCGESNAMCTQLCAGDRAPAGAACQLVQQQREASGKQRSSAAPRNNSSQ